ncbi:DUF3429 domain-containing protein [Aurantimonas sp. A2-1-M11]|uniref:DUF3429 domain-containing protein n=1 Tax=Aurantimonas sp. A2-1-M11 TaxID=3113712 RepID=UPI002F94B23E
MTDIDRYDHEPVAAPHGVPASAAITHKTAWILGLLGLIPFVVMAAMLAYAGRAFIAYPQLVLALSGYSATILAFLGGIRWGAALWHEPGKRRILILSVVASLIGWVLLFVPTPWVFAGFAAAFALVGLWDVLAARQLTLPYWFGRLRLVLTVVVTLCQIVAFVSTV